MPPAARDGLDVLVRDADINLRRAGDKLEYFSFLRDGLTKEKLETLGVAVDAEILRLKGPDFQPKARTAALSAEFDNLIVGKTPGEQLAFLSALIDNSEQLPPRAKNELTRKLAAMVRTVDPANIADA